MAGVRRMERGSGRWRGWAAWGMSAAAAAACAGASPPIYMAAGTVETPGDGSAPARLAAAAGSAKRVVVQLDGPMTPARRARLHEAGVAVGDYLPADAYIVGLRHADPGLVRGLTFVRWCGEFRPEWKLDRGIGKAPAVTDERARLHERGRLALVVTLFPGAPRQDVVRALWAIPGTEVHWNEAVARHDTLGVEVEAGSVGLVAAIDAVQFVEEAPQVAPRNSSARWVVASNRPGEVPAWGAGLRGQGQVIGVLDTRVDRNHCAFADTNPVGPLHRKILAYNASPGADGHGTHVAGSALGDAGLDDDTRGLAHAAKLVYGPIPARNESSIAAALAQHAAQGAAVHSNSWGNDATTAYDSLCRGLDGFLHDQEGALAVVAVSNLPTIRNPENAKNVLAVAASGDAPQQELACAGGAGPTADGRRKPEVLAPGCGILSAAARTACGVAADSGTSMAAPLVAGAGALVRQYFMSGYYPSGAPRAPDAFTPSGALLRAVLVNSAVDMAGVSGYPSALEGWGRLLLDNALDLPGGSRRLMVDEVPNAGGLATGGEVAARVFVTTPGRPLRVTLAWTDPPAAPGVALAAVNDLDLVVEEPGGAVYLGNVFAGGFSAPGGERDRLNNLEQVHVAGPRAGEWRVRVRGAGVAVGRQGYALCVTGDVAPDPPALSIQPVEPPPVLLRPGQATAIDVAIRPRGDALVPGSAALVYRFRGGTWNSEPLTPLGGDLWRGVLPGAPCGQAPEFYLTAQGVQSGQRFSPPDAAMNPFVADVGALERDTLLDESFEGGVPPEWLSTGLWRATTRCAPPPCDGATYAYFGSETTCTYATGFRVSGVLAAPPILLPRLHPAGGVTLTYCCTLQTEGVAGYDRADVLVNGVVVDEPAETEAWTERRVDLSSFAGQTVRLTFRFDSVDGYVNSFRGFQVDSVRVEVTQPACDPGCYADCDTGGGRGVLDIFDFLCFQNRYAGGDPYACDCDPSAGPGVCDIFDFLCFQNAFDAGCP